MKHLTAAAAATAAVFAALATGTATAQEGPGDMMGGFHGEIDFVTIDADGDGTLTRAELQARAAERLARADLNGDGSLDRAEIVAILPGPHGGFLNLFAEDPAERMADRLIALMGGTEAGRIEVAALADRRVNALLALADADRDAVITEEEAQAAADRLDRPGPWHERGRGQERDRERGEGPRQG
jgi:Ca2+-binding EF-hand superfamily protein